MTVLETYTPNFLVNLHRAVIRKKGRHPKICTKCKKKGALIGGKWSIHWANVSGKYISVDDFKAMCRSCHTKYDIKIGHRKKPPSLLGKKLPKWRVEKARLASMEGWKKRKEKGLQMGHRHTVKTKKKISIIKKKWWKNKKGL